MLDRQVVVSATEPKHCLRLLIKGETEIKMIIHWKEVLNNVGENKVKSRGRV